MVGAGRRQSTVSIIWPMLGPFTTVSHARGVKSREEGVGAF